MAQQGSNIADTVDCTVPAPVQFSEGYELDFVVSVWIVRLLELGTRFKANCLAVWSGLTTTC